MATLIAYNVDRHRSDPKRACRSIDVLLSPRGSSIHSLLYRCIEERLAKPYHLGLFQATPIGFLTSSGSSHQIPCTWDEGKGRSGTLYRTIRCTLNSRLVKSSIRPSSPSIISLIACSRRASTGGFVPVDIDLGSVGTGVIGSVVAPLTAVLRNVTR
jgi:hypothetical protein